MIELLICCGLGAVLLLLHFCAVVVYKFATHSKKSVFELFDEL